MQKDQFCRWARKEIVNNEWKQMFDMYTECRYLHIVPFIYTLNQTFVFLKVCKGEEWPLYDVSLTSILHLMYVQITLISIRLSAQNYLCSLSLDPSSQGFLSRLGHLSLEWIFFPNRSNDTFVD